MKTTDNITNDNQIWLRWFAYSIIAVSVALAIMMLFLGKVINHLPPLLFGAITGDLFGVCIGIAQAIVLKKYILKWKQWIVNTTIAWIIFWSLNMAGYFGRGDDLTGKIAEGIVHGLLFGCIVGFLQSTSFSQRDLKREWIMISIFIWGSSAAIADGLKIILNWQGPVEFIIGLPLASLMSGIAMQQVLNHQNVLQKLNSNTGYIE